MSSKKNPARSAIAEENTADNMTEDNTPGGRSQRSLSVMVRGALKSKHASPRSSGRESSRFRQIPAPDLFQRERNSLAVQTDPLPEPRHFPTPESP